MTSIGKTEFKLDQNTPVSKARVWIRSFKNIAKARTKVRKLLAYNALELKGHAWPKLPREPSAKATAVELQKYSRELKLHEDLEDAKYDLVALMQANMSDDLYEIVRNMNGAETEDGLELLKRVEGMFHKSNNAEKMRCVGEIVTLRQGPDEEVIQYANRAHVLHAEAERLKIKFIDILKVQVLRGVREDLKHVQQDTSLDENASLQDVLKLIQQKDEAQKVYATKVQEPKVMFSTKPKEAEWTTVENKRKCKVCNEKHNYWQCPKYKEMVAAQKAYAARRAGGKSEKFSKFHGTGALKKVIEKKTDARANQVQAGYDWDGYASANILLLEPEASDETVDDFAEFMAGTASNTYELPAAAVTVVHNKESKFSGDITSGRSCCTHVIAEKLMEISEASIVCTITVLDNVYRKSRGAKKLASADVKALHAGEYVYRWNTPDNTGYVTAVLDGAAQVNCINLPPSAFTEYRQLKKPFLIGGSSEKAEPLPAIGIGTWNGIQNVYCVPGLSAPLISESILADLVLGGKLGYRQGPDMTKTFYHANGSILCRAKLDRKRKLWTFPAKAYPTSQALTLLAGGIDANPAMQAHRALGHPNWAVLRQLNREGKLHPTLSERQLREAERLTCDGCRLAKMTRARKPEEAIRREPEPFHQFSMDIATLSTESMEGDKYVLMFWDKRTGACHPKGLKSRTGEAVAAALKEYVEKIVKPATTASKFVAQVLRSDGAKEFLSTEVTAVCREYNIVREVSCPFSSYQNGGAERAIRTIMTKARTMLVDARLPLRFWAHAVDYASFLHNRLPCRTRDMRSPFELAFGAAPDLSNCQIFGTRCFIKKLNNEIKASEKMSPVAFRGVFLGLARKQKGYRVFNEETRKVVVRESVTFDTSTRWNSHGLEPGPNEDKLVRERNATGRTMPLTDHKRRPTRSRAPPQRLQEGRTFATSVIKNGPVLSYSPDVPKSMKKAVQGPEGQFWRVSGAAELESLRSNDVYEVVPIPEGVKLLHMLWVLAKKQDEHGRVIRFKARTVVNGSQQVHGEHYTATAAPVPAAQTIRTVISVAAARRMKLRQWDFETAFLNSTLEEGIRVHTRPPFGVKLPPGMCWRLKRSIYGLKQASRDWFNTLTAALEEAGLTQSTADPCLFIGKDRHGKDFYFVFHVDDCLLAVDDLETETELYNKLAKVFKINRMGKLSWFLGMKIEHLRDGGFRIHQAKYITDVLKRFGAWDCTPVDTPGDPKAKLHMLVGRGVQLTKQEEKKAKGPLYKEIVGSILYAASWTRPEIADVVGLLSRAMDCPKMEHWKAVKRLLRYLRGTVDLGLTYKGRVNLEGYTDANWAGDTECRSTGGYVFFLNGGAISWSSKRQKAVALSSCESEYYAASAAVSECIWLRRLCKELGMRTENATSIVWEDNQGAIALSQNPVKRTTSRHIDVRYHFLRQHVKAKTVELKYVRTKDNVADALTKPLPRPIFLVHRNKLMGEQAKPYKFVYTGGMDLIQHEKRN